MAQSSRICSLTQDSLVRPQAHQAPSGLVSACDGRR